MPEVQFRFGSSAQDDSGNDVTPDHLAHLPPDLMSLRLGNSWLCKSLFALTEGYIITKSFWPGSPKTSRNAPSGKSI